MKRIVLSVFLLLAAFCNSPAIASTLFTATLTPDQVVVGSGDPDPAASSLAFGTATLSLDLSGPSPTLSYSIQFSNLDLTSDPRVEPLFGVNKVRGVHIHLGGIGGEGPHVLNVLGAPRDDDADLIPSPSTDSLSGVWDDSDENFGPDGMRDSFDSIALTDALADLQAGNLYFQIHSYFFRDGEIRGQIVPIPEIQTTFFLMICASLLMIRRRNSG